MSSIAANIKLYAKAIKYFRIIKKMRSHPSKGVLSPRISNFLLDVSPFLFRRAFGVPPLRAKVADRNVVGNKFQEFLIAALRLEAFLVNENEINESLSESI